MFSSQSRTFISISLSAFLLTGCGSDSNSPSTDGIQNEPDSATGTKELSGLSQKGPFLKGSMITANELLTDGQLGPASSSTETSDDRGTFSFNSLNWTGPTRLQINGLFFDENSGVISSEQRQLDAVVSADNVNQANINLYTHMVAGRIISLLGKGEGFEDAQSQAQSEWQAIVGTSHAGYELDVLNGAKSDEEHDSANLLLFSAAVLAQGATQADLDAIRSDFADDGQINGSGKTIFNAVRTKAATIPDLLADARANLESEFGVKPPEALDASYAWVLDACSAAALTESRLMCDDRTFTGDHLNDSGEFVAFVPSETGHYTVELFGDPEVSDDNTGRCSWTIYTAKDRNSTEYGDSGYTDGWCGVEDVSSSRLTGGRTYYVRPVVSQDNDPGPVASFRLSATRVSDGRQSPNGANELPLNTTVEGVVGKLIGQTTESFYRFTAGQGNHTITVQGYPCGDGALRLELYEDNFGGSAIAKDWEADKCTQTIEQSLEVGKEYYLKVENYLGSWHRDVSRPSPGNVDYDIQINTQ